MAMMREVLDKPLQPQQPAKSIGEALGRVINREREKKGLTQSEMFKKAGITKHRTDATRCEQGKFGNRIAQLSALLPVLEMSFQQFLQLAAAECATVAIDKGSLHWNPVVDPSKLINYVAEPVIKAKA